jgi:paraquat-inducible protein B
MQTKAGTEKMPEDDIPQAIPEAHRGAARWRWALLIWVVPLVALAIGGWLAVRGLLSQGPSVTISFKTGSGIEAGRTRIKYRDVDIGLVRSIGLSENRDTVLVDAELSPQARSLLGDETTFWVVRPRVTGGQAFGLGTILSGAYIAMDAGKTRSSRREFTGLETPPVVTGDVPGRQFVLHAETLGSLDVGSPVYFRRVRVGQIVSSELNSDGSGVTFRLFVNSPYDQYVTQASRFWNASGIDFTADSGGFRLETESLASVVIGGVAFQTPPEAGAAPAAQKVADNGASFRLFKDRDTAFKQPATVKDTYILYFKQSVRGLNVGSPVDFRGVPIGEVTRISLDYDRERADLRPSVEIDVYPERIAARFRKPGAPSATPVRAQALQRFVDRGLRAQLRTGNLVTGQVYITLDFFPKAVAAKVDPGHTPLEIPTVPGGFEEIQASVTNVLQKLEKVPLDDIAGDVRGAIGALQATLQDLSRMASRVETEIAPELRATLEQARATLDKAQAALSDDAPMQGDLRGTLREVSRAAQSMRSLADTLERHPESILRGRREEASR